MTYLGRYRALEDLADDVESAVKSLVKTNNADFLIDLGNWLRWKDNTVFDKSKGSWIDENEINRLNKLFGEK